MTMLASLVSLSSLAKLIKNRRIQITIAGLAVVGLAAFHLATQAASSHQWLRTDSAEAGVAITDPIAELLSGIDFVPTRALLDQAFGVSAPVSLELIARNTNQMFDIGLRVRAYYGLSLYPQSSIAPLIDAVDEHGSNLITTGPDLVLAKAALGALATVTPSASSTQQRLAFDQFRDVLNHPVLDLRAAAAAALGKTGLSMAESALTTRLPIETAPQVIEAINAALAQLGDTIVGPN